MIDALKDDDVVNKVGGHFRLTSLIQKRWLELLQGARPQVDATGSNSSRSAWPRRTEKSASLATPAAINTSSQMIYFRTRLTG